MKIIITNRFSTTFLEEKLKEKENRHCKSNKSNKSHLSLKRKEKVKLKF